MLFKIFASIPYAKSLDPSSMAPHASSKISDSSDLMSELVFGNSLGLLDGNPQ